jgi:AraC-like DNA-binding protein
VCLPGQLHVLHPDETHDGRAGTDEGFSYRIIYVAPALIQDALHGRGLPFVRDPVPSNIATTQRLATLLYQVGEPISDLARVDIVVTIADALVSLSESPDHGRTVMDTRAVDTVRDHLAAHACEKTSASALEQISGLDRFTLARQFRRAYGTSPDRYRTMRRLALARTAIERGVPLAVAALDSGFADQSHLTRQFRRTYGLTPARWARTVVGT